MYLAGAITVLLAATPAADAPLAAPPAADTESPAAVQHRRAVIVGGTDLALIATGATVWILGSAPRLTVSWMTDDRFGTIAE